MEKRDDPRNLANLARDVCDVLDASVKNPAEARVLARVIEGLSTNDVEQPAGASAERRCAPSRRSAIIEIIKAEAAKSPMTFGRGAIATTLRSGPRKPHRNGSSPGPQSRPGGVALGRDQLETAPATATAKAPLYMHLYFVKNGRIVATEELLDLFPHEAIETARKAFEEGGSSYDGVEVWSFTRRIFGLGLPAREPAGAAPAESD